MWSFSTKKDGEAPSSHAPAPGMRLYVFGDVHGRFDLFASARRFVADDVALRQPARPLALFLGDLIDRGPESAGIVEALATGDFPIPSVVLRGNHEQMMLDGLREDRPLEAWLRNGGFATLSSYGIAVDGFETLDDVRDAIHRQVPEHHLAFMEGLGTSAVSGDYFFCHAGVRPEVPLFAQVDADLLWIRRPFLESRRYHGKMVVHGHTPVAVPELLPNRIGIDTGAYASGNLTCLILEGEEVIPYTVQPDFG
jgi:serine/threonine protein phosphatase 1